MQTFRSMSQDKLTAARLLLVGLFAFAWKKKQMFMVLTYEDDLGLVQNPVFHIKKNKINEVQPTIYQRMMNARMTTRTTATACWQLARKTGSIHSL